MELECTPTRVNAAVIVAIAISLACRALIRYLIHYTRKYLKKKNQKPLFDASQKVEEDLIRLCIIYLLLVVIENKVPLVSPQDLHRMHLFISVIGIVHMSFSVLTVVIGEQGCVIFLGPLRRKRFVLWFLHSRPANSLIPAPTMIRLEEVCKNK